jgi:hypothetical protein
VFNQFRRVKRYLIIFFCAVSIFQVQAQGKRQIEYSGFFDSYYYRGPIAYTVGLGISSYRGDLTNNAFDFNPAVAFSLGANYKTWPRTAFGAEFNYVMLSGKDQNTDRNLQFTGTVKSFGAYARFYLIDDVIRNARDRTRKPKVFKTYVTTGINYLLYSAKATYAGATTDTILSESGYPTKGFGIPVGLGFQWAITHRVGFVTELQYNFTFTDYLDGVSARGNPSQNDGYALINFKLQICPSAPKMKKAQSLPPPAQYDGPKGTETWKTRRAKEKERRPVQEEYVLPGEEPNADPDAPQDGSPQDADPNANPDGGTIEEAPADAPSEDVPADGQ